MSELEDWKKYIKLEEYEKIANFIEQTKNNKKIINKFLFIVGNIQKAVKLVIDIENEIGVDDCDYIEFPNLGQIFVPDEGNYILQPEYVNTKCLTVELINHNKYSFSIIKEICNKNCFNFNLIIITENLFIDLSMMARSIVVNV